MKTIIKLFICLSLIYTPFFAFAGAAENWEIVSNTYDSERNRVNIEARKITQSAANSGRYKVEIPVNANTLGATAKRMLWGGVAVGAITALVEGVGWVIDEATQQIRKPVDPADELPFVDYYWIWNGLGSVISHELYIQYGGTTPEQACQEIAHLYPQWGGQIKSVQITSPNGATCYFNDAKTWAQHVSRRANSWKEEGTPPQSQPVSDFELGNEILGNGTEPNSRTSPATDIITDAYSPNNPVQTAPAPQETLRALELVNPEPETEPKGEAETEQEIDPETGEATGKEKTTFELPNFCSWAPAVCDFFTVQKADNKDIKNNQREQIEQDKTFFEKVAEWFDWSQADDDLPDNESPEIVEHVTPELHENAISWGAACPADVSIPISMQGVSSTLVFSWSPWCQLLSIIKPAIIASAYIGAAFIVLGLRT